MEGGSNGVGQFSAQTNNRGLADIKLETVQPYAILSNRLDIDCMPFRSANWPSGHLRHILRHWRALNVLSYDLGRWLCHLVNYLKISFVIVS